MAGIVFCSKCQHPLTAKEQFCGNCGTRVYSAVPQPIIAATLCTRCGSPLGPGNAFCSHCGASSLSEEGDPTVPAWKPTNLSATAVDPLALTVADDFVIKIPLRPEDLEPDFAELKNKRWYRRNLKGLRVHIDNHDFCSKVEEIAAKTARDLKFSETNSPQARDDFLQGIKEIADELPLKLPLYWANLSELVAKALIEMASLYEYNCRVVGIAEMSAERIFKHAHFRLASYLSSAISPNSAEKFGFPDIAMYMRKYEKYCKDKDDEYGELRAVAEIYTGKKYENKPESRAEPYGFIGATLMGRDDRRVAIQRLYLSRSWHIPTMVTDLIDKEQAMFFSTPALEEHLIKLEEELEVNRAIDKNQWCVHCLPQILVEHLSSATFHETEAIEESEYELGLNRNDYNEIRPKAIPF